MSVMQITSWATQAENNQCAYDTGAKKSGEQSYQSKLSNEQVREIRRVYKKGDPEFGMVALGKKFRVHLNVIKNVVDGKTYKNVV